MDDIFGLGPSDASTISQLSSHGMAPKVFSHCLKGWQWGGQLILGQILEQNIVHTSYAPITVCHSSQETFISCKYIFMFDDYYHYNLNLQSIAVNGQCCKSII